MPTNQQHYIYLKLLLLRSLLILLRDFLLGKLWPLIPAYAGGLRVGGVWTFRPLTAFVGVTLLFVACVCVGIQVEKRKQRIFLIKT